MKTIKAKTKINTQAPEISGIEVCGFVINSSDIWNEDGDQKLLYIKKNKKEYLLYENEYEVIPDSKISKKNISKEITFLKSEISQLSKRLDFLLKTKKELDSLKEKNVDMLTLKLYKILLNNKNDSYKIAQEIQKEKLK